MVKIEASTLAEAYKKASATLRCSASELKVEVIQKPSPGVFGLFKKSAIIVASHSPKLDEEEYENYEDEIEEEVYKAPVEKVVVRKEKKRVVTKEAKSVKREVEKKTEVPKVKKELRVKKRKPAYETKDFDDVPEVKYEPREKKKRVVRKTAPKVKFAPKSREKVIQNKQKVLNDTIMPTSFVSDQDDEYDDLNSGVNYTADYADEYDNDQEVESDIQEIANSISTEINALFDLTCFNISSIEVTVYDEKTVLVIFKGNDSALLIGKEGYRYKAISYMIFNWVNSKYDVQLRLEIAEFLKNQEDSVDRYLVAIRDTVEREGRAQTKILDGVLIQIALRKLRDTYPDKYVVIRSTRDGLKYIIINDFHSK